MKRRNIYVKRVDQDQLARLSEHFKKNKSDSEIYRLAIKELYLKLVYKP